MDRKRIKVSDDSQYVRIGHFHQHTLKLSRPATKREVVRALRDVPNVSPTRPAACVIDQARTALVQAGLMDT